MTEEKTTAPRLRFPGFTGPWEQRKVGDFLVESRIKGNAGNKARKITVKLWGKGVVEKNDFGGSEHTQYYIRRAGQFIYSKLDFLNCAFGVIPENLDGFESTADLPAFDLTNMNPYYLYYVAIQEDFYLKNGSIADGSRKAKRIHADTFLSMPISVPEMKEQKGIVDFLQSLDNLITLHQHKIDEMKEYKQGMLQKMFPKPGETEPEIRFPGFTGPWEQRKLGEIADIVGGGTPSTTNEKFWDGEIDWYAPAEIADQIHVSSSQRKITKMGYENCSAKMLPVGTVLFTSRAGIGKTAILSKEACTNQGFQSIVPHKEELNSYFIFSRTDELKKYGETVGAGSTFVEVSGKQMANMALMMPTTLEEQKAIGYFFEKLDKTIILHQRKIDAMKEYKNGLLQQMFV